MGERDDPPEEGSAFAPTLDSGAAAFAPTLDSGAKAADPALAPTLAPSTLGGPASHDELTHEHSGRYRRGDELGRGGMGRVVLVHDAHLGREVAMKELLAQAGKGSAANASMGVVTRFLREARVTGQLEHPGIVPVYELGRRADGTLYYTMKRVRGRSLASLLAEAKSLEDRLKLLSVFRDVCEAMAYAHSRGVVHRDLKPDNVMVGEFGETLIVDWGLAKVRGEDDPRGREIERRVKSLESTSAASTLDGHAIGTPAYMSPEQARGALEAIDERSDVWGLGAMLFEILTGRPPHTGASALEVLHKVLEERPPSVREVCPEAPAELAAVADRALLRDPSSRYPGAAELSAEIVAFQDGRQVHAYDYSALELVRRFVTRHRAASLVVVALLVATVTTSVFVYGSYRSEQESRRIAESRRDDALRERERAEEGQRDAQVALAEGLLERAERALAEGDPSAAAIFAAGALVRDPANPHSPRYEETTLGADERRAARERVARAFSAYLDADDARRFIFVRRVGGATARGALAPDGRTLVFPTGHTLAVEDLSDGARRSIGVDAQAILTFLDAERVVVSGPAPGVYALRDGTLLHRLPDGTAYAASSRGRLAVSTETGSIVVLDAASYESLAVVEAGRPSGLAWLGDSLAGLGVHSATLRRWSWPPSDAPALVELPSAAFAIAASPDGASLAVGLGDPAVAILRADPFQIAQAIPTDGWVTGARWLSSSLLLTAEDRDRAVLRNVSSGRRLDTLHTPSSSGQSVHGAGLRGHVVVLPAPTSARLPRASVFRFERERQRRTRPLGESIRAVALDARRPRVIVATLRTLVALPLTRGGIGGPELLATLPAGTSPPVNVAVARDGAVAMVTADASVLLYEPETGQLRVLEEARASRGCAFGLSFDLAGDMLFVADAEGAIRRWRRSRGQWQRPLEGHTDAVCGLALSPDGEALASVSRDATMRLWDLDRADPLRTLDHPTAALSAVAFARDGERIAMGDDAGEITIVRRSDGSEVTRFRAHDARIEALVFSPDGQRLATASEDRTVRWIDADGERIRRIVRTRGVPLDVEVSARGSYLYYFDTHEVVRLAADPAVDPRDPEQLLRRAEARAGQRLERLELRTRE